jgi:hypothetical protein
MVFKLIVVAKVVVVKYFKYCFTTLTTKNLLVYMYVVRDTVGATVIAGSGGLFFGSSLFRFGQTSGWLH